MSEIYRHQLSNGLWLLAEPVEGAQSLAMTLLLPAGVASEPAGQQGAATLLAEMINRGAGDRDARAHSDALDQLGVQRGSGAETHFIRLAASMIGTKLPDAMPLLIDMVRRPTLAESALGPSRDLAVQAIESLEDEPQQKVFHELRQRHYPQPFGRSSLGKREDLEKITAAQIKAYWQQAFVPARAILGFAGHFDWPRLRDLTDRLLGDWKGSAAEPAVSKPAPRGHHHVTAETAQVHIGLAYDAPPEIDERSILQKAAVAVLSGGMSGRLFTEVREKRGLCYSVYARYGGDRHRGAVLAYSGTTAPRAQETFDVLVAELKRLSDGIDQDEFDRAIVGMKSGLVMQGESTAARAASIASDQAIHARPRSLAELAALVDSVKLDSLRHYVKQSPPGPMTVVTIGPEALRVA